MSFKEPEGQVARWIETLQSYVFTVVHRAGASQANADALSHRPCALGGCQYCERGETRERECRIEEETCPIHEAARPVCCGTQMVDAAEWQT